MTAGRGRGKKAAGNAADVVPISLPGGTTLVIPLTSPTAEDPPVELDAAQVAL
jgi:hypothetical protein